MNHIYLSLCIVWHCAFAKLFFTKELDKEEDVIQTAIKIANANFDYRLQTVVISKDVDKEVVDEFLQHYKGAVIVEIKRDGPPPSHVVMIVNTYYSFTLITDVLKPDLKGNNLIRGSVKFLIVIMTPPYKLDKINGLLWSHHAADVVVIVNNNNGKTVLYTFFPYKNESNCADVEPYLIGFWDDALKIDELYANKVSDMKGCPMYISTNKVYHPATEAKIPLQVTRRNLHRMLGDIMNYKQKLLISEYISIDSDSARNWTSSLSDVILGNANISTCSIPLGSEPASMLHYTMPYFRIRLAWFAPPTTTGSMWWKLFSPLNGYLWLAIITVLFLVKLIPFLRSLQSVKKFCSRYLKNANNLQGVPFRIWGVFIGQPIRVKPRKFRDFYVISLWMWFTFVIRSVYQIVLIGALKTDTIVGNFANLKEAFHDGIKFGGRSGILLYFEYDPLIRENFQVINESAFEKLFRNVLERKSKFIIATSLEYSWTLCLSEAISESKCGYILPDSILMVPLVIWTRNNSPFIKSLSIWLPRIFESGLLEKDSVQKPLRALSISPEPSPITLKQLSSCLLCLLIGYIISITVFICEVLKQQVDNKKKQNEQKTYCTRPNNVLKDYNF
ncbi:unnamed protein product [Leptidea sinapis]|uniref:Putative ionotropic receptor ligand binding domain-containing protein n=1 Tax=Leptidea sinapis TaxID=189913 RepID=A0A5E4Q3D9_9NEOP|nr:unnamed protein product [Leptidea sinapis]